MRIGKVRRQTPGEPKPEPPIEIVEMRRRIEQTRLMSAHSLTHEDVVRIISQDHEFDSAVRHSAWGNEGTPDARLLTEQFLTGVFRGVQSRLTVHGRLPLGLDIGIEFRWDEPSAGDLQIGITSLGGT